ncbi:hypothetical protein EYD45_00385 [Hyunsoonleella flava]|uniref:Uncharacterized protein n=2 Tax=Pseudomonadati TaxID=3379134 RepID=A0A839IZG3_9GAMM|nr:hypothetical protein [Hyunsoonleella flava]MBB1489747.1 hypothetical protein [Oceanospirillum sediminis]TBN06378.1 hypothetical protein EYD45_00385 [Hyunsoonleella flava]
MEDNTIKQVLKKHLKTTGNENFNYQIIQQLNLEQKKQRPNLFNETSIINWFLVVSGFVLFFYLQQESKIDANAISIGCIICAVPLYLLIFNKIYSLKKNIQ